MKKYIIGAFIGFILSLGVGAHAEVVNMIGKAVDGAFPVKVNGVKVENPAIVIEGTSYLPVRAMGDVLGMDVKFDASMGIELTQKAVKPTVTDSSATPIKTAEDIKQEIDSIKNYIGAMKAAISGASWSLDNSPNASEEDIKSINQQISKNQQYIQEAEVKLADLQSQLNALQ